IFKVFILNILLVKVHPLIITIHEKANPVVLLFGDMPILLSSIYSKAPHLGGKWEAAEPDEATKLVVSKTYSLLQGVDLAKHQHVEYASLFTRTINTVRELC